MPNEELEMTMQMPSTKQETQKFEYKREDCENGNLNDPREIAEFVRTQQKDILQNALLGDYDNLGDYYLSEEIRDELVRCPKVITSNYENYIFAQAIAPIGDFGYPKFYIVVNQLEKKLIATLTFVEPIHKMNKLVTNAQSVQIASYIDVAGEKFYYDMKDEFHIVNDDYVMPDDEKKKMFPVSLKKKMTRIAVYKQAQKGIERTEKIIYEKRMEILKKADNEFSKVVLADFNEKFKKRAPFFNKADNQYTCLNQLLDECIELVTGKFPEQQAKVMSKIFGAIEPFVEEQKKEIYDAKVAVTKKQEPTKGFSKTEKAKIEPITIQPQRREVQKDDMSIGGFKVTKKQEKIKEERKPKKEERAIGTLTGYDDMQKATQPIKTIGKQIQPNGIKKPGIDIDLGR